MATALDSYQRSIAPSNALGCVKGRSFLMTVTNDSMRFFVVVIFGNPNRRAEVDLLCGRKVPQIGEQVGHGLGQGLLDTRLRPDPWLACMLLGPLKPRRFVVGLSSWLFLRSCFVTQPKRPLLILSCLLIDCEPVE